MYSVLQGYIPSISMTSKSVICFPFFCPTSFFCKILNLFFLSVIFQFLVYSLLCFLLKILCLSSYLLLSCCNFSIHKNISVSGNQLWKLYAQTIYLVASCQCCLQSISYGKFMASSLLLGCIKVLNHTLCIYSLVHVFLVEIQTIVPCLYPCMCM